MCAHSGGVAATYPVTCNAWGGTAFARESEAEAEHKRLKGGTAPVVKTASSSGSENVWCVSRGIVDYRKASSCKARGGKGYSSIDMAHAEHNPLKTSSSSSSSTASSSSSTTSSSVFESTYCYSVKYDLFYRPATAHCSGSDKKVSKREYSNRHLDTTSTTTTASSFEKRVWCATKHSIFEASEFLCKSKGGKGYKYQEQAISQHLSFKKVLRPISQHLFQKGASPNYSYSDKIWCVEKWDYTYMPYGRCVARGGEVFASENQDKYSLASPAIASTQAWNSLFDNPDHDPGWSSNSYWCVAKNRIWETTGWDCWRNNKGEYFTTQAEAEAEQNNLKWGKKGLWCITDKSKAQYTTEAECKASGQTGFSNNSFYSKALAKAEARTRVPLPTVASVSAGLSWCVTYYGIKQMSDMSCAYVGGTPYSSFDSAVAVLEQQSIGNSAPDLRKGWCATPNWVQKTTVVFCDASDGEFFENQSFAEAQYELLTQLGHSRDYSNTAYCLDQRSGTYYFGPYRDPWSGGCSLSDLEVSLHEYLQETSVPVLAAEVVWCATAFGVSKTIKSDCDGIRGKALPNELQAKYEHSRLKRPDIFGIGDTDNDKSNYVHRIERRPTLVFALAISTDSWGEGSGSTVFEAKEAALQDCRDSHGTDHDCEIVDVNGAWPFIDKVWCTTDSSVVATTRKLCGDWDGRAYSTKSLAEQKLNNASLEDASSTAYKMPDNGKAYYLAGIGLTKFYNGGGGHVALALSSDNYWFSRWGGTIISAQQGALMRCKSETKNACKIMDVDGESPFIDKVWCVHSGVVATTIRNLCDTWDGTAYSTKILAGTGFQRTKDSGRATASTSGRTLIWCGKSFKKSCSEKTESVALHPSTGWCASPWQVRYTSRKNCGRTDEELWPTKSGAQTAHARLRNEHYEGLNVVVWCATADSFQKTRITDCESIDGTTWSTEALASAEHNRLKSVLSVAQVQVPKKVWCATASDTWETTESTCHSLGGRRFGDRRIALNESARRLKAQKDREQIQRENNEAIAQRKQNLEKLLATKSCRECDLRGVDLRKADLNGAILVKADLQGASLVMASLAGSNLTGANLKEVDLTGANLAKATLRKADLSQAHVTPRFLNLFPTNLSWADLSEAKLIGANLAGVNFTGAVLTQADLTRANLLNADLEDADLSAAILIETSLIEADLDHADLTDANLSRANLTDACLDRTNLSRANLSNTFLSKATFRKANLNQVNLQKSRLSNADLSGIDLRGADLSGANLTRADLRGTGLEGAQLHGANLYEADLTGAD